MATAVKEAPTTTKAPPATDADIEAILGQYLIGFGRGVGNLHVHRGAVTAARKRCKEWISGYVNSAHDWNEQWKADAATVIGFMEAVGRLSAHIAMQKSRTTISEADFTAAVNVVVPEHPFKVKIRGHWCQ
jgi:hypothetical protein